MMLSLRKRSKGFSPDWGERRRMCRHVSGVGLLGAYRRQYVLSYVCGIGGVRGQQRLAQYRIRSE